MLFLSRRAPSEGPTTWLGRRFLWKARTLSQETITQILALEQAAAGIFEDTQRKAERLVSEANQAASVLQQQTLAHARQQAEQITAESKTASEIARARIIAQAEAEAQRLEMLADQHLNRATAFVLDQVAERE